MSSEIVGDLELDRRELGTADLFHQLRTSAT
jgi:hypothetical protein